MVAWSTPTDAPNALFADVAGKVGDLFPSAHALLSTSTVPSKAHYQAYLQLYQRIRFEGEETEENLAALGALLRQSPGLTSAYELFRKTAIHLYRETGEARFLQTLEAFLTRTDDDFFRSAFYATNAFWLYLERQDYARAEAMIERASQRGLNAWGRLEMEAAFYFDKGQFPNAAQAYERLAGHSQNVSYLYSLAITKWYLGEYAQVSELLQNILTLQPEHHAAKQVLGAVALLRGDANLAISTYEKLIEHQAQSLELNNLSLAYLLIGDLERASQRVSQALRLSPQNASVLLNQADIEALMGNHSKADALYRQIIALTGNEQDLEALLVASQAHAHLQDFSRALDALKKADALAPDDAEVAFVSALIHTLANEPNSAVLRVEQAVSAGLGPAWFSLPWFQPLCESARFSGIFASDNPVCADTAR